MNLPSIDPQTLEKIGRSIVPLITHLYQVGFIDMWCPKTRRLEPDYGSIMFIICVSLYLSHWKTLAPHPYYEPNSSWLHLLLMVGKNLQSRIEILNSFSCSSGS